ncbi:MAG TPA: amidohydrolase [Fimbriimonadaceae bacterium]|jgi:hypothetical protein
MPELYHHFLWGFDGEPQVMFVENGRVVFREPAKLFPTLPDHPLHDLGGKYLIPAFIDSHCHILPSGLDFLKLNLGQCHTPEATLETVSKHHKALEPDQWLLAVHYDQTRFSSGQHLTRHDLDGISSSRPILLRHANGHASVANTALLEAAGIEPDVQDPKGGQYVRGADGALTGVLLERAHERVTNALPKPDLEQMVEAILKASDYMANMGIACASDMMTGVFNLEQELEAYRLASERGCKIRMRLYMQWSSVFGPRALPRRRLEDLDLAMDGDRCCIAGVKIFADGAIGSATAGIYGRFLTSDAPENAYSDGQLIYEQDRLQRMISTAHDSGYRISVHSIGDHSTDLVMDAFSCVDDAARHRIEHAMLLSDDQIARVERLGIHCCMQPEFLPHFGHAYNRQLGPERAAHLNRYRSVLDAGIPLSFSSDMPITKGNPWHGVRAAESRPSGFEPSENLTRAEALYAYTAMGAAANDDALSMGWLMPGQVADFQLYDSDPLEMDAATPPIDLHVAI